MTEVLTLTCPIRGVLRTGARSADGLRPSEEKLRVDAIKHLIELGYPKENIKVEAVVRRFGNSGRNSFRADLAVLDVPVSGIPHGDIDQLLAHAVILAEVKRDNNAFDYVKHTQVEPLLDFASRNDCLALYWDDVEQRVFWQESKDGLREKKDGPLAILPPYGQGIQLSPLTFSDITPPDSLLDTFRRIEDVLHAASVDPEQRYSVMLQLLLAKLFDEHAHENAVDQPLDIQDFMALGVQPNIALYKFNHILGRAASYYSRHLPRPVESTLFISGDVLIEVLQVLAPIKIIATKQGVTQAFYMYFAKHLYRWDLAQYFTPVTLTEFIVQVLSPKFGEHIKDPACGSADFLTAAFRIGREVDPNYADCIWGSDNSTNAVQVAVLNMLLNGDGKSNIVEEDTLESINNNLEKYEILVCNPPFGTKIVERRSRVLAQFDLGYAWEKDADGVYQKTSRMLDKQEAGLLFIEACIKQAKPGGRIGIILPNGYLGNKSPKYHSVREYMLRYCKVASICSFPRFTFKTSGADVSASVVFLEKRSAPIASASLTEDYMFNVEMIEKVGWDVGNKRAEPIYRRNPEDGSYIVSDDGSLIIDADFSGALADLRSSDAAQYFSWLGSHAQANTNKGWSVNIRTVFEEPTMALDPKRYCRKVTKLRSEIKSMEHFKLGDVVEILPEGVSSEGVRHRNVPSKTYRYVELQDIGNGEYDSVELRGWELPARAKHHAEAGDMYVGSIWGSVGKWFYAGRNVKDLIVTNGCFRLQLKAGKEEYLPDIIAGLCTESYAAQMRSFARGSDGLAEVSAEDVYEVLLPRIVDKAVRTDLDDYIELLKEGRTGVNSAVSQLVANKILQIPVPPKRPSHSVLV